MALVTRKPLFLALICFTLVACKAAEPEPTDSGTLDTVATDSGTPDAASDEGTATDEGTPDVGTPDAGSPDEGPAVDVPPAPIDNLLGSACVEDTDCAQDPEHVCFFGFCTTRCRESGDLIPGACGDVSAQSIYGDQWACPSDIVYCMPGSVQDQAVICTKDTECNPFGNGVFCAGAILSDASHVDGMCLPTNGASAHGESCLDGDECQSLLCMGADPENAQPGTCLTHCEGNGDCGESPHVCQGIGFITDSEVDPPVVGAWAGLCVPAGAGSSLEYCGFAECPEGDSCSASTRPDNFLAQYWCVEGNAGGAEAGEECTQSSDCFNGSCFYGDTEIEGATGYCTRLCPSSASPCPDGMHCTQLTLNEKGTPEVLWDDPTFGICTYGEAGRPCELDTAGWCDEGLTCLAQEGDTFPEGTGLCGDIPCEASCGEAVCGDDGCGGSCGSCEDGFGCNAGACAAICTVPCAENASCTAPDVCTCNEGFEGDDCATPICTEACGENASCTAPDTCSCDEGFVGDACQYSDATTCNSNGAAQEDGSCVCGEDFEGDDCTTPICTDACGENASCTAPDTCSCDEGFVGDACEFTDATTCNGNGAAQGDGSCICNEGFEGDDCAQVSACSTPLGCIDEPCTDDSECAGGVCTTIVEFSLVGENDETTSCQVQCDTPFSLSLDPLPGCPDGYECLGVITPADPESDLPFNQSIGVCEKHPDDGSVSLGDTCYEDAHCVSGLCMTGEICLGGECGGFCTQECTPPDSTDPPLPCPEGFECQTYISELEGTEHFCVGTFGQIPLD